MGQLQKMNNSPDLIGPCQHCGNGVEFPETAAGSIALCPHCGQQTTLSAQSRLPGQSDTSRSRSMWIVLCIVAFVLAAGAGIFVLKHKKPAPTPQPLAAQPSETISNPPTVATQQVAQVAAKPQKSESDFKVSDIKLEKTKGSSLVYAVGTLKNDSEFQRFGVRIEIDLADRKGTNVGKASDYIAVLEPHQTWPFHALITDPKAFTAKVASIKEAE
ncbi:MAG: hypothetical protein JWQ71_739 [Pedosphaera sp.]|nr:hypothetical protein [Pedosphaera sp.]